MATTRDPYLAFHRLQRSFQRRNRFVGSAYGTPLSPAQAHILLDAEIGPTRPTDLSSRLRLAPAHVSRLLKGLVERGLVSVRGAPEDKRARVIEMSEAGREFMKTYHDLANSSLERFSFGTARREVSRLVELLERLADRLGAAPLPMPPSAHPLRGPIARITRSLGLLGNVAYTASGLTALQYQIVFELAISQEPRIAADFVALFETAPNTISQSLQRLRDAALIERYETGRDRRSTGVRLSEEGRRKVEEIEEIGARQIRLAMRNEPEHEMHELVYLFGKMMGEIPRQAAVMLQSRYEAVGIDNDHEYGRARRFAVEVLAEQKGRKVPEMLVSSRSRSYMLLCEGAMEAVVEIQPGEGKPLMYVYARQPSKLSMLEDFTRYALRVYFSESGVSSIECPRGGLPSALARALLGAGHGDIDRRSVLSDS